MIANNIILTIIIATYNAEMYIGSALASLVGKVNSTTEVIIIDGLSTDNTLNIINDYKTIVSAIYSERDLGIYDAMNKGVQRSNGKFILFLGADDELTCCINKLQPYLQSEKNIYYGNVILTPKNELYGGKFTLPKLLKKNICHQSILYPRKVLIEHSFELKYKLMADYVLNMKLWALNYRFVYINEIISKYSLEGSSSIVIDQNFKKDSILLVYSFFGIKGLLIKALNPIKKMMKFNFYG